MFVDTNFVLRWVLKDHPTQSSEVVSIIQGSADDQLLITDVVLSEIYYVLIKQKGLNNREVAEIFEILHAQPAFSVDNERVFALFSKVLAATNLDFADCYLIARALYDRQDLKTFDKPMQKVYDRYNQPDFTF